MKLLSYEYAGRRSWGVVRGDGVLDLATVSAGRDKAGASIGGADEKGTFFPTLRSALSADVVEELLRRAEGRANDAVLADIRYLPVIPEPQKIFCVGLNYDEHRIEANRPVTGEPTIFMRTPTSQVGHLEALVLPKESRAFDYEGEIAIVIGRPGRRISQQDAWRHIAGYAAYNDGSIRDWQTHTSQWTGGKNFDATGSFGPWLVTRDEIDDDEELTLVTRLNGVEMQRATTRMMLFGIPKLVAYLSTFATLLPGDVIVTGTPGGVGFKRVPPVFMAHGDVVEIEVEKVGVLVNRVRDEGGDH
jgi:2-keto-4-pentenoate hydratase/2-oxohepta-3-ene-1,7-dioic acid hydratase in catechol pathway